MWGLPKKKPRARNIVPQSVSWLLARCTGAGRIWGLPRDGAQNCHFLCPAYFRSFLSSIYMCHIIAKMWRTDPECGGIGTFYLAWHPVTPSLAVTLLPCPYFSYRLALLFLIHVHICGGRTEPILDVEVTSMRIAACCTAQLSVLPTPPNSPLFLTLFLFRLSTRKRI